MPGNPSLPRQAVYLPAMPGYPVQATLPSFQAILENTETFPWPYPKVKVVVVLVPGCELASSVDAV